ncbi:MAG: dihydropteroate synthase [Candidatus Hydrogenedentes bacterium]|nr:dihydropteroate synthase [Candidatus Hydrogenedentota bacterium]
METETLQVGAGQKTLVMGVVNVTPDSFYDGGRLAGPAEAVAHAQTLAADGADLLDIGGESSRPGAEPVPPAEEMARVLPVCERLQALPTPVSIDTYHAETARRALALGVSMVNDITALRGDPDMAAVVAGAGCHCVLMHMQGAPRTMQRDPRYDDVIDDIAAFFEERMAFAVAEGVREEAIWLDPGFGFGKTVDHNLTILRRLAEFKRLGRPILIGTSNKSTIGAVLDLPVQERMEGTAATVAVAVCNGADAVRVHDVRAMARVARMSDAIIKRGRDD